MHHGVEITDPAIVAAAELSHRYITDRFLPDKAIDLIDEAAARIKMEIDSKPEAMDRLDRRLIQLKIEREAVQEGEGRGVEASASALIEEEIEQLQNANTPTSRKSGRPRRPQVAGHARTSRKRSSKLQPQMEELQAQGRLATRCRELQYGKLPQLETQLKKADRARRTSRRKKPQLLRTQVGAEEIAEVVSRATGIPVSKMMQGEREKLLHMEDELHQRVVGQDEAVRLGVRRDPPLALGPVRSEPAVRLVPVPRARPASARPSCARRSPSSCSTREEHLIRIDMSRVHGEALGRAPDRRAAGLRRLRGGRLPHRGGAPQALLA